MLGDYSAARSYHVQSLAIARESGNLYTEIYTLINLAAVVSAQGDAQLALQYTVRALELSRRVGDRGGEAWALFYSGQAALVQKNTEQAQSAFRQSLNIRTELGLSSLVMESIAGLVQAALETEDYDTAFGYAEKILSHLASGGTFEGAEEPLRIYLACYLALEQRRDPRANKILQIAAEKLKTQTSRIHDETARLRYVENVPWRRAIWKACRSVID
jgi:ATP/maltotriose-dependent transcriptional regulator MalT